MSRSPTVDASNYRPAIASLGPSGSTVWELAPPQIPGPYPGRTRPAGPHLDAIRVCAAESLRTPLDYPTVEDFIMQDDRVALAVDPNVPAPVTILRGLIEVIAKAGAGHISLVLWEETPAELYQTLRQELTGEAVASCGATTIELVRHSATDRSEHRYVVADEEALPVYLSRHLVDADVVIPVAVARRAGCPDRDCVRTIEAMFLDAETMTRYRQGLFSPNLLGAGVMVLVSSNAGGDVGCILAGTPDAIGQQIAAYDDHGGHEQRSDSLTEDQRVVQEPDAVSNASLGPFTESSLETSTDRDPTADLVLAALDGGPDVQSWSNVARAAVAASRLRREGGVIVIWSRLSTPCPPAWQRLMMRIEDDSRDGDAAAGDDPVARKLAEQLAELCRSGTVWLHSDLPRDDVEQLGLAVIDDLHELKHLATSFRTAGVLRAASYHGAAW